MHNTQSFALATSLSCLMLMSSPQAAAADSAATLAAPAAQVWISLGDAALAELQALQPQLKAEHSVAAAQAPALLDAGQLQRKGEALHLLKVDPALLASLSAALHDKLHRCGGYMFHPSQAEGMQALKAHGTGTRSAALATVATVARPSYVIDQQSTVNPMLAQMQASNIGQTIVDLSAFTNRYYTTSGGVNASNWLKTRWANLASGRSDITVEQFTHASWAQKSVIATFKGTDNAAEVVVLGAHLDSINSQGTSESTRAPGADDDASGVASLTELMRVLIASNYKPRRTIKFMAYAAEEVGLRGSQEIANSYAAAGTQVVGVMQLDMTNYKGAANDIYIFTDYTDSAQNQFVTQLIQTYLPTLKIGTDRCGYACSDHASWNAKGFATSMPFESSFAADNPYIHSVNDTYANTGGQAEHSLKFARMALAFAVELGSDGAGTPPPTTKTETFNGSLTRSQTRAFGPFKVAAGGSFKASTTGTGDIDLYVKRTTAPTTTSYDCKSDGSSSTETCTLSASSSASNVYLLLSGYAAGNYQLTVTYSPQP